MRTRILIADDHPFIRSGIRMEIARHSDLEVVAEVETRDQVLDRLKNTPVDIILQDIRMPGMDPRELIQSVKKNYPETKILILTVHSDKGTVLSMLRAGADGYVLKDEDPNLIIEAVRALVKGKPWLSPAIAAHLIGEIDGRNVSPGDTMLTERECIVVRLIAEGWPTREIARHIQMSDRTVETHITNIYNKLGLRSRQKVALWARDNGIV